jgi:hypothetical protein
MIPVTKIPTIENVNNLPQQIYHVFLDYHIH